jgi:hypothetical protein
MSEMRRIKSTHWSKFGKRPKKKRGRVSAYLDIEIIESLKRAKRSNADISQIIEDALVVYFSENPI